MLNVRTFISAVFLLPALGAVELWAYPSYIQHGYPRCATCHNSPRGAGSLTDYGRGIDGSLSIIVTEVEETTSWIRHGTQTRGMLLENASGLSAFPMQLDYLATIRKGTEHRIDVALGIQPERASAGIVNKTFLDDVVLRRLNYAYSPREGVEVSFGRDFLPFGLNIDDHTAFIRSSNRRGVKDYQTRLGLDYWTDDFHIAPFVYLPTFQETEGNRESGGGVWSEVSLAEHVAVGASALMGSTKNVFRGAGSLFARGSLGPLGLMAEYDLTARRDRTTDTGLLPQHAIFLSPFYFPTEWLEIDVPIERIDSPLYGKNWKYGAGFKLKIFHAVSLLADYRRTKPDLQPDGEEDAWFTQIFINL